MSVHGLKAVAIQFMAWEPCYSLMLFLRLCLSHCFQSMSISDCWRNAQLPSALAGGWKSNCDSALAKREISVAAKANIYSQKIPRLKSRGNYRFHTTLTIHNSQFTTHTHNSHLTIHTSQFTLTIHNSHLILMPCHYKPCHMDISSLLHLQHIRTLRKHRYIDSAINRLLLSHQYTSDIKDGIHILSCNSFYV